MSKNHVEECLGGAHEGKPDAISSMSCPGPKLLIERELKILQERGLLPSQNDSAAHKAAPLWSGCMAYFPDALLAVARLSKKGNDKHNPGEPLHWSREKSTDHGDCIARHQLNPEAIDPDTGEVHAVAVAWRALAQLQLILEKRK